MDGTRDSQNPSFSAKNDTQCAPSAGGGSQNSNTVGPQMSANNSLEPMSAGRQQPNIDNGTPHPAKTPELMQASVKKALLISAIVLGLVLLVVILWIAISALLKNNSSSDPGQLNPVEEKERDEENRALYKDIYDKASNESTQEEADNVFQEAIDAAGGDSVEAEVAKVSQLNYWLMEGDFDKIFEVIDESTGGNDGNGENDAYPLCENPALGLSTRMVCHYILASAYYHRDEFEMSDYHKQRRQELFEQQVQLEHPQG